MATSDRSADGRAEVGMPSAYYGYAPAQANAVALHEVVQILRRHRWMVAAIVVGVSALSGLLGYLNPPQYRSTAMVAINPAKSPIDGLDGVAERLTADDSSIETQLNVIRSGKILNQVVANLDLANDRRFIEPDTVGRRLQALWSPLFGPLMPQSVAEANPESLTAGATLASAKADDLTSRQHVEQLADRLKVAQAGRSQAIQITYSADDPQLAAAIANEVAKVYAGWQLGEQHRANDLAYRWLEQRLQVLKGEVAQGEASIESYRLQNNLQGRDGESFATEQLKDFSKQLIEVRANLASAQARIDVINGLRGRSDSLDRLAKVIDSTAVNDLRSEELALKRREAELTNIYGPRHPLVVELRSDQVALQGNIQREIDLVVSKFKNEMVVLQNMQSSIDTEIEKVKGQLGVDQQAVVRLRELEREASSSRELYESLLTRYKELREQESVLRSDVQLVEEALPAAQPSSPSALMFAAVGFMASSFVGAAAAVARDRMDGTVRSISQLERSTELRGLGLLPRVRGLWQEISAAEYIKDKPLSSYVEGLRALYLAIKSDSEQLEGKIVLVTSALPSEGKSSATIGLASFLASLGHRTIVIDLDLRKPTLTDKLGIPVARRTINEVLQESLVITEAAVESPVAGLDFIPAKPTVRDPAALLEPERLAGVLSVLRQSYDYILLDSPPVLMMSDTNLIVKVVDQTVLVVRWGHTALDAVLGAISELQQRRAKIAGFVLNLVDMKKYEDYAVAYRDPRGHYKYVRGYYRE